MNTKMIVCLFTAILLFTASFAEAQQPRQVPRIGFVTAGSSSTIAARIEALRQGLRDLGYTEDQNIIIEWRFAEGKADRLPALMAELVRLKVEVIVTAGPTVTRAAKEATVSIPIVMAFDTDPVGNGLVASLARPGRNITGLSVLAPELSGKQLELLKEIVPKLSSVAFIGSSSEPGVTQALRETKLAAGVLGVRLQYLEIRDSRDIATAFQETTKAHAQALLILQLPILASQRAHIADLALKNRLPAIYGQPEYMDVGGLLYYGASINDMFRRAATYVDKILKGTKPADLPVEQPTKFEFIINLKAA